MGIPLRPPLRKPVKAKSRRRKREAVPEPMRQEVIEFAKRLQGNYGPSFAAHPRLKHLVGRLLAFALPPLPRRPGRPGYPEVTRAMKMLGELRRLHPDESYRSLWRRIYPIVIIGHDSLNKPERRAAKQMLRDRVRWRRRQARRFRIMH